MLRIAGHLHPNLDRRRRAASTQSMHHTSTSPAVCLYLAASKIPRSFVVMQIERQLEAKRIEEAERAAADPAAELPPPRPKPTPEVEERAKRLDPTTRPAALVLGRNVDRPRNLAKTVTVE